MSHVRESRMADDLRDLTEALANAGWQPSGGFLGGEFGYGAEYENDVFEMHPFHWGDCECGYESREWDWYETNQHDVHCYQAEIRRRGFRSPLDGESDGSYAEREARNHAITDQVCAEMGLDPHMGSYVHCTCSYRERAAAWHATPEGQHSETCRVVLPNFRHKVSGYSLTWYKYIGRGMEFEPIDRQRWQQIMAESLGSITQGDWVKPAPLTPEEEEAVYREFEKSVYVFEGSLPEVFQQIDETMRPVAAIERLEADEF